MKELREIAKERYKDWESLSPEDRASTIQSLEQHRMTSMEGVRSGNKSRSQEVSQITKRVGKDVSSDISLHKKIQLIKYQAWWHGHTHWHCIVVHHWSY